MFVNRFFFKNEKLQMNKNKKNRGIIAENYPVSGHGILKYMNRFSQKNEQVLFEERYQTFRDLRLSSDFFLNILNVNNLL